MRNSLFIIYVLITGCINGQGGFRSRIYLPSAPDHQAKAIFETSPGNYVAAGFAADTAGWPQEINRLTMMGLDQNGNLKWHKQYGSFKFHYLNNGLVSRSYYRLGQAIYYTGCVFDTTSKQIGVLIKFNLNGDTVWQRIFRDPDPQEDVIPQMVTQSVDGGFLITGFFQHWGGGGTRCLLIKTDANGKELWRKKISKAPPNVQDGKAIIQDSASKKIVIAGYKYPYGNSNHHNILVLDSLGNQLHSGNFGIGHPLDMIQGTDGYCYITGYRSEMDQFSNYYNTPFVARFSIDTPSYFLWYKEYKPKSMSSGFAGIREVPGGLLMCGWLDTTAEVTGYADTHLRMTRVDLNGNKLSDRYYRYKPPGMTSGFNLGTGAFETTHDGGWVVPIELSYNPKPNPFFFVKYDSTGCDSTTLYCLSVITGNSHTTAKAVRGLRVTPNPASHQVTVTVNGTPPLPGCLVLREVSGREVLRTKMDEPEIEIVLDRVENGLYFLFFETGNETFCSGKLIIAK